MDRAAPPWVRVTGGVLLPLVIGALAMQPAPARTHVLIVAGIGGEARYTQSFFEAGSAMAAAVRERFGVADSNVVFLAEDPSRAPSVIHGRSTREEIGRALARLAQHAAPDDRVLVLLIGHGTRGAREPTFNLPGRDLTAAELGRLVAAVPARRIAVVNASSASGDFIPVLAGPGRVIITATKSAAEGNETRFAAHFVDAFARDVADVDKDGAVSLLEAFAYARAEVVRGYERENRLLTEHALLDDDGDGRGSASPSATGEGSLASTFVFSPAGGAVAARAAVDPALAKLQEEKRELEALLHALRQRKDRLAEAAYERELEALLVAIAEADQAIRTRMEREP